ALSVSVAHPSFDEWWTPFTLGVGPAGQHVRGLDGSGRAALRERCLARLGPGPIDITAIAWSAKGRVRD
ncbi:MAG TPA: hypothetical protein VF484_09400, partial [Candidatus Limnocylindrales bacterium]